MKIPIQKVAVLGSGIMGSGIACQLANTGFRVLLLDRVTPGLREEEKNNRKARNRMVNESLEKMIGAKPAALYKPTYAARISTGNFEDDLSKINTCEWIIEAIVEDPVAKKKLYQQVNEHRKPGTIFSTNTSGIPVSYLAEGLHEDFTKHFIGTHFFNPPRYLSLLEIVPGRETAPELTRFMLDFGRRILGKETVQCKDTPAFIANRIGVYSILRILELTRKHRFDIETVDTLTGQLIGRPKTGTFRLQDLIGVDIGVHVLKSVSQNCPNDEYLAEQSRQGLPGYIQYLLKKGFLGNKTGQGFYRKTPQKGPDGKRIIEVLDLNTLEYRPTKKPRLASLMEAEGLVPLAGRLQMFFREGDEGNDFLQEYFIGLFGYVSHRIPEICDQLYAIDEAMKGGYGWEYGPFEYWDMIGVENVLSRAEQSGISVAQWVREMISAGKKRFYRQENGRQMAYDPEKKEYSPIPGRDRQLLIRNHRNKKLFGNSEASLFDIGEGVICVEFHSRNNVLGEGTGEAIHKALDKAVEEGWKGVVIGNDSPNFTVGADLMLIATAAQNKDWAQLERMSQAFQDLNSRLRYAPVPVVTATRGYVFGGGIEMSMHADGVAAAAESYIGLVEAGVGLIPGGGGTMEFAKRLSASFYDGDVMIPRLVSMFRTITMAEVATSAPMAFDLNYLLPERDRVVLNSREVIYEAKNRVLALSDRYLPPLPGKLFVLGRTGLATLMAAISEFKLGSFISDHDALIARKTAWVMCGGDLSAPQEVSEQYLLDLEREAFVGLCGEQKTLDRIRYMLKYNKPLRN